MALISQTANSPRPLQFEEGGWKFMNSKSSGAVSHALQQLKTESPAVLRTVLENPPHFVFHATRQR